jgi:hypothetical protein
MGRGVAFTPSEDDFISTNAEIKTARELLDLHGELRADMLWPERTVKSLARRVERLRDDGKVGKRDDDTRRKAYYARVNKTIRGE